MIKASFDTLNVQLNTLHHFLCIPPDDLCYLGPISWNCPNPPNTLKQVQRLSDGLKSWVRLHLMWNLQFSTLDDFWYILAHVMGYLGPISWTGANALHTWLRPHLIPEMYSWAHCVNFCVYLLMICVIWTQFPEIALIPQIH